MNVIFLDIDGVMNSNIFYHQRHKKRWLKPITYYYIIKSKLRYVFNGFKYKSISLSNYKLDPKHNEFAYKFKRLEEETDKEKWNWLSNFCNEYDYKICISSVWKNHFKETSEWNDALIKLGFKDDIFVGITGNRKHNRGEEIKEWIDSNEDVDNYAIIDDDSDMLSEQMKHFFHVDNYYGLTPNHLYRIDRHFKKLSNYSHLNENLNN